MNQAAALEYYALGSEQNFARAVFGSSAQIPTKLPTQLRYVYAYLKDLGTRRIIAEPVYFDRDYLAEFSAYYGAGARGYRNVCRRLHYFGDIGTEKSLRTALGGNSDVVKQIQDGYHGFTVIRPVPNASFGRSVLSWYSDTDPPSRVTQPSRQYETHLAGLTLKVKNLAWQQQDRGVSACATIGLWSMLHASAFNERSAIPTTVAITRAAHKSVAIGLRVFPSGGLTVEQICEAIKSFGLAPLIVRGEVQGGDPLLDSFFDKKKFCRSISALVRSGFPCMLIGLVQSSRATSGSSAGQAVPPEGHTNVCVGFRDKPIGDNDPGGLTFTDQGLDFLYAHDDNVGPGVKFSISEAAAPIQNQALAAAVEDAQAPSVVGLRPYKQDPTESAITDGYGTIFPQYILCAVEDDLRTDPVEFAEKAQFYGDLIHDSRQSLRQHPDPHMKTLVGIRFWKVSTFLGRELERRLSGSADVLSRVRLELQEQVGPMSLYVSVIRIADQNAPILDFLFDSTDHVGNAQVFATVNYSPSCDQVVNALRPSWVGKIITAH